MLRQKSTSLLLLVLLAVSVFAAALSASAQTVTYWRVTFATSTGGDIVVTYSGVDHGAGTYTLTDGKAVTITAEADSGYIFDYFSFLVNGNTGTTTVNPISTTILSGFTVTAHFKQVTTVKQLTSLSCLTAGGGAGNSATMSYGGNSATITDLETGSWWRFDDGTSFTVTAQPISGFDFICFSVNGVNQTGDSLSYVANMQRTIIAYFTSTPITHNVFAVTIVAEGSVLHANSVEINWGSEVNYANEGAASWWRVEPDTSVSILALPDNSYSFTCFEVEGVNFTDASLALTVNQTYFSVIAYFEPLPASQRFILSLTLHTDAEALLLGNNTVVFEYGSGEAILKEGETGTWVRLYTTTTVSISARPDSPNFEFSYWIINGETYTSGELSFSVNNHTVIEAWFHYLAPAPTPSGGPNVFDGGRFAADMTSVVELIVGVALTFVGIFIMLKSSAWIAGIIVLIAGFFIFLICMPNVYGLVGFFLTVILSTIFGFSMAKEAGANKNR